MSRFSICQVKGFFFRAIFGVFPKIGGGVVTKMDGLLVISGKTFIKMPWGYDYFSETLSYVVKLDKLRS